MYLVHGLPVLGKTVQFPSSTNNFFFYFKKFYCSLFLTEAHGNVSENHAGRVIERIFTVSSL